MHAMIIAKTIVKRRMNGIYNTHVRPPKSELMCVHDWDRMSEHTGNWNT